MGRARDRASADLNGQEFILDADADTSISADTDDQIDIRIAGADDFQFTANTFTAQSGSTIAAQALTATTVTTSSTIDVQGNEIILDDDGDTSITADSDDTINFKVGGTDRVTMDVNGDVRIDTGDIFFATAGKGICLGATTNADANTLDDYEEGTWTASQSVGGNSSISASDQQYVKVGRMVHISLTISFSGSDTDRVSIAGLPFTATNSAAISTFFAGNAFSDFKVLVSGNTMLGSNTGGDANYTSVNGMTARFSGTYMATA